MSDSPQKSHKQQKKEKLVKKIQKIEEETPDPIPSYPPISQEQLRIVLIDFMSSEQFDYPIHSQELMTAIKDLFKEHKDTEKFMKHLDILQILEEFKEKVAVNLITQAVGVNQRVFVQKINKDKLRQLAIEFNKDRPIKMPTLEDYIKQDTLISKKRKTDIMFIKSKQEGGIVNVSILPKIAQQKNTGQKANFTLLYEDNLVQISLKKKQMLCKLTQQESDVLRLFRSDFTKSLDFCDFATREKCIQNRGIASACPRTHIKKLIKNITIESYGNCQYVDNCRDDNCQLVHYQIDKSSELQMRKPSQQIDTVSLSPQWVNCDLRVFDFRVLGKFDVIMADPPWDIHMNLPYGTMKDKEMKALRVDLLSDEGLIFLWVTGRAMELGRECLHIWGYRRVEEIVWVKTNQLQKVIRTGRTGHWLNHSKEHCLVGIKGNPVINRNIDCDVIVSEVRETSRKPDEIYGLITRMMPNSKRIELFGRPHNCRPNWMTLGNQLPGVYIQDPNILHSFQETYPEFDATEEGMKVNLQKMNDQEDLNAIYNNHIKK